MIKLCLFLILFLPLSLVGQCMDFDEHNTSTTDMWISCEKRPIPLIDTVLGHWILYEFDQVESIEAMQIWNVNHPLYYSFGAKSIKLETSEDGARWATRDTFLLASAHGDEAYIGETFEEMEAFEAKFVLLTILENYGGQCAGLAELKFVLGKVRTSTTEEYLVNQVLTMPNPADESVRINFNDLGSSIFSYRIVDMVGRVHQYREVDNHGTISDLTISTAKLPDGQYALQLNTDQGVIAKSIVVVHAN